MADRSFTPTQPNGPVATPYTPRHRRGAKALVRSGDRVLLVRERHHDGDVFWTLPGGGVESTESLRDGLKRELIEELQCPAVVRDVRSSFKYAHRGKPGTVSTYVVFETRLLAAPSPNSREGVTGYRWVDPNDPPAETLPQVANVLAELST